MSTPIIRVEGLIKIYPMEGETVVALNGIDLEVQTGEFLSVMGTSGSGKSTLMHILGLLDSLTEGTYELEGHDVSSVSREMKADLRNQRIGFIFQTFNLLARSTALDNVKLPMVYCRPRIDGIDQKAMAALKIVGLENRAYHLPRQLSGGQQQRVAVARALVNDPSIILADEPTGNLDTKTGWEIMNLLRSLNEEGITVIVVTHDIEVGRYTRRRIVIRDGMVLRDEED